MSDERPNAAELLAIARETFVRDILPTVPEDVRYRALMIANAMAIAVRETNALDAANAAAYARLQHIFGDTSAADRVSLERRLARALREGTYSEAERTEIAAHLRATTRDFAAISNPKALE